MSAIGDRGIGYFRDHERRRNFSRISASAPLFYYRYYLIRYQITLAQAGRSDNI